MHFKRNYQQSKEEGLHIIGLCLVVEFVRGRSVNIGDNLFCYTPRYVLFCRNFPFHKTYKSFIEMWNALLKIGYIFYTARRLATGVWGIYEIGQITVKNEFQQKLGTLKDDRKLWKKPNSFKFARGIYNVLINPPGPPELHLGPLTPPLCPCLPQAIGIYCLF